MSRTTSMDGKSTWSKAKKDYEFDASIKAILTKDSARSREQLGLPPLRTEEREGFEEDSKDIKELATSLKQKHKSLKSFNEWLPKRIATHIDTQAYDDKYNKEILELVDIITTGIHHMEILADKIN